jgi:asparagine synthase (glutamine-hydrolysing)
MSGILIIRDHDPVRRRLGIQAAESALRRFDLVVSSAEHGTIAIVWGTFPGAPVTRSPGAFVMGDVIPGPGPERLTAEGYAERLAHDETPPSFDGFHFAASFDERGALTVAVDILGAFAVYHASVGETLLIGSSPALITAYPGFNATFDPAGLVALLITNGPVRGRTPYTGIRRLAAGHALVAAPGGPLREERHYAIELNLASHDVPAEECALRVYEAFVEAAKRHVPTDVPHTMLLSGGIDSRLVTGVLARQGVPLNVITRGDPGDLEYYCARAVARHLRLPHHLVPHGDGTFERFERSLWWEGMACAPGIGGGGGLDETLHQARSYLVAGYMADPILGGVTATKAFDRASRTASFEQFIRRTNVWGVPVDVLPRLLRKDVFGDGLQMVLDELREDFMNAAGANLARSWLFTMELRERFAMGQMWGRLAFRGWPRVPQVDRALIRVVAGVPLPVLAGRRVEREILQRFLTDLARLPLDRNALDVTPPLPGVMDLVRAGIDRRIRRFREKIGIPRPERRYYHRTYDFNGGAWRMTRHGADADRERAYALFDRATFDSIVPPADQRWQPTGAIEGAAGAKMLTSLGVWLRVGLS